MTPTQVASLLDDFGCFRWTMTPYGFELSPDSCFIERRVRLERGSGIAGRGDRWSLVEVASGARTRSVTSRCDLRRMIVEWLAGPRPVHPGLSFYARKNSNRFGTAYIWVPRRWSRREADP